MSVRSPAAGRECDTHGLFLLLPGELLLASTWVVHSFNGGRLQSATGGDRLCCCVQGEKGEPGERGDKGNPGESVGHLSRVLSRSRQ